MQRSTVTEDLTSVEWRDTNWIERFGGFQNQQMVMDYFSMSPFWDRQCNNQVLAMQTQYNDLRQSYEATLDALRKMTGIEFAVVHEQPPVWVIQKRYRRGPAPDDVNPIATYYIMGANVYQSPTIYSVIANRLLTSLFHVNSAFKEAKQWMEYHPAKGYSWKTSKQQPTDKVLEPSGTLRARENQEFRHWMDRAIEASALRIAQNRYALDHTESAAGGVSRTTAKSAMDSSISAAAVAQQNRAEEAAGGKRQRKKTEEGALPKRKKKAATLK